MFFSNSSVFNSWQGQLSVSHLYMIWSIVNWTCLTCTFQWWSQWEQNFRTTDKVSTSIVMKRKNTRITPPDVLVYLLVSKKFEDYPPRCPGVSIRRKKTMTLWWIWREVDNSSPSRGMVNRCVGWFSDWGQWVVCPRRRALWACSSVISLGFWWWGSFPCLFRGTLGTRRSAVSGSRRGGDIVFFFG